MESKKIPKRNEVAVEETWNLTDLFKDFDDWQKQP